MESSSDELGERLAQQSSRLRLLLAHLTGRALLARAGLDDLLQEVFVRAVTTTSELPAREPGDRALARVLNTIARHVVIDAARAARAAKRDGRELAITDWSRGGVRASGVLDRAAGPATEAVGREVQSELVRAFRALAPDHRRVLGLRQFEGLSAAETAGRMRRSETAVHSLYRRALEAWETATAELRGPD